MQRIHVWLVLFLLIFASGIASGQNTAQELNLRLEDCVRLALERNKDYVMAEKEVEIQKAGERAAFAAKLPSLSLTGSYTMLDPDTVDGSIMTIPAEMLGSPVDVEVQNAFTHNLAFGLSAQYAIPWIPFFSQGAWGRAHIGHQIAKRSLIMAENKLKKITLDVKAGVKKAFYGLLIAEKVLEVTTANEQRVKAYLDVAEANFNAGRISEYEVLR